MNFRYPSKNKTNGKTRLLKQAGPGGNKTELAHCVENLVSLYKFRMGHVTDSKPPNDHQISKGRSPRCQRAPLCAGHCPTAPWQARSRSSWTRVGSTVLDPSLLLQPTRATFRADGMGWRHRQWASAGNHGQHVGTASRASTCSL